MIGRHEVNRPDSLWELLGLGSREETVWVVDALCAQTDPEAFFPERGKPTRPAKAVCVVCPVQPECRAYALAQGERFGVWGGLSERERRTRRRTAGADAADGVGEVAA